MKHDWKWWLGQFLAYTLMAVAIVVVILIVAVVLLGLLNVLNILCLNLGV